MIVKLSIIRKLSNMALRVTLQSRQGMRKCAEEDAYAYETPLPGTNQYNYQLPQGSNSAIPDPNDPDNAMHTQAWDDNDATITPDYLNNRMRTALDDLDAGRIDDNQFTQMRDRFQNYAYNANVPYQYLNWSDAAERRARTGDYTPLSSDAIQGILNGGTFNPDAETVSNPYQAVSPAMATGYTDSAGQPVPVNRTGSEFPINFAFPVTTGEQVPASLVPDGPSYAQMPQPNRNGTVFPIEQIRNAGNSAQYGMSGTPIEFQAQLQKNSPTGTYSPISREMSEYGLSSYKYVPNNTAGMPSTQNDSASSTGAPQQSDNSITWNKVDPAEHADWLRSVMYKAQDEYSPEALKKQTERNANLFGPHKAVRIARQRNGYYRLFSGFDPEDPVNSFTNAGYSLYSDGNGNLSARFNRKNKDGGDSVVITHPATWSYTRQYPPVTPGDTTAPAMPSSTPADPAQPMGSPDPPKPPAQPMGPPVPPKPPAAPAQPMAQPTNTQIDTLMDPSGFIKKFTGAS